MSEISLRACCRRPGAARASFEYERQTWRGSFTRSRSVSGSSGAAEHGEESQADALPNTHTPHLADPADELDPEVVALLRAAVQERSDAERHVLDAIRAARRAGMSWSTIGLFVGTSGETARQRYRNEVA